MTAVVIHRNTAIIVGKMSLSHIGPERLLDDFLLFHPKDAVVNYYTNITNIVKEWDLVNYVSTREWLQLNCKGKN